MTFEEAFDAYKNGRRIKRSVHLMSWYQLDVSGKGGHDSIPTRDMLEGDWEILNPAVTITKEDFMAKWKHITDKNPLEDEVFMQLCSRYGL